MKKFISDCKAQQPPSGMPPAGMQPPFGRKSNKGLIIAIIAIVVVIIVVVLAVVLLLGGSDSRFVGEWEQDSGYGMAVTWNFKSDGKLEVMGMEVGTWSVSGDELCLEFGSEWAELAGGDPSDLKQCVDYEFSDGGNTLTLTQDGVPVVLTKK